MVRQILNLGPAALRKLVQLQEQPLQPNRGLLGHLLVFPTSFPQIRNLLRESILLSMVFLIRLREDGIRIFSLWLPLPAFLLVILPLLNQLKFWELRALFWI